MRDLRDGDGVLVFERLFDLGFTWFVNGDVIGGGDGGFKCCC